MKGKGRLFLTLGIITVFVFIFSQCTDTGKELKANEATVAGAKTCIQCHQKIYDNYLKDPHTHTSSPVKGDELVSGGNPASNVYQFDKHLKVVVEKRKDGMYQVAYFDGQEGMARRFDLVIGSGKNAHTYGSWKGTKLNQMPLSYFRVIDNWANSPGFPADQVYFTRKMDVKCLECHSSYIEHSTEQSGALNVEDKLEKNSLIYGIDCERCHGPAGMHAEFHLKNPEEKTAKYIALYKTLTRKQKMDACGVCHSGANQDQIKSTFAFKPGDNLSDYFVQAPGTFQEGEPDVHGNQLQMLSLSKCYIKSTMDCGTCHNPHESQPVAMTAFSKKCISCHATIKHSEKTLANAMVKTDCISCHMPLQSSKVISFKQAGSKEVSPYKLHTHRIAVYH